ncbi:MAG: PIG-L deacetylase family protein [Propionibacteriaceae bacterium]
MADLELVDESWDTALCVVAHPDDLEFGTAAAIARWTAQGKRVVYAVLTSGEAGIDSLAPDECRPVREAEQREAAALVGVDTVEFLGLADGTLEYGVPLRRVVCAAVRRHRPEVVITNNLRETWIGGLLNQADHVATGRATLDATRDAANRWVFPEGRGESAWAGVRQVWAAGSPRSTHGVETTETFDRGVASLAAHRTYNEGLGWPGFRPDTFLARGGRAAGARLDVEMATVFEVFSLAGGM